MGKVIEASFDEIATGENILHENLLAGVIKFSNSGKKLSPIPVRKINGKYLQLDGQHRLIYHYLKEYEKLEIYLAETPYDIMKKDIFDYVDDLTLWDNNFCIEQRWNCDLLNENYHEHMKNLRSIYEFLKDYETCEKYLKSKHLL